MYIHTVLLLLVIVTTIGLVAFLIQSALEYIGWWERPGTSRNIKLTASPPKLDLTPPINGSSDLNELDEVNDSSSQCLVKDIPPHLLFKEEQKVDTSKLKPDTEGGKVEVPECNVGKLKGEAIPPGSKGSLDGTSSLREDDCSTVHAPPKSNASPRNPAPDMDDMEPKFPDFTDIDDRSKETCQLLAWARWARDKIDSLRTRLVEAARTRDDMLREIKKLRADLVAKEDAIKGMDTWLRARKSVESYDIGAEVYFGERQDGKPIKGRIEAVEIRRGGVYYKVGWWGSDDYHERILVADQVRLVQGDILVPPTITFNRKQS